jgi:regulatory protein
MADRLIPIQAHDRGQAAEQGQAGAPASAKAPGLSLKGRALRHLSLREHSWLELQRKLAPHAESPEQLDRLRHELEAAGWLSAERFAESVAHRKAAKYGTARIQAELRQHQIPPDVADDVLSRLRDSELQRAHAAWSRRFDQPPQDAQARAKQHRFLAQRGFAGGVIQKILQGWTPEA